jgi:hypothetical protein
MRSTLLVLILILLVACHRSQDVSGLYISQRGEGLFLPCDDPAMVIHIQDSALSTRYHRLADSTNQPVMARLRGVRRDSGSIYGGEHFLDVKEIIEVRARAPGECPGIAPIMPSLDSGS